MSRAIDVEKAVEIIEEKQKELCPIQCEWCRWKDTFCDGKTPEWRGIKEG